MQQWALPSVVEVSLTSVLKASVPPSVPQASLKHSVLGLLLQEVQRAALPSVNQWALPSVQPSVRQWVLR